MLPRVGGAERALADRTAEAAASDPGVEAALAALPAQARRDAGVMYDRLRWRRKNGIEAGVREILLNPPDELRRPELWWREQDKAIRAALARALLQARLSARQRQPPEERQRASPRRSGRPAGWRCSSPASRRPRAGISSGCGPPWRRRSAGAAPATGRAGPPPRSGASDAAAGWYERAAAYPNSFYGQLAAAEIGPRPDQPASRRHGGLAGGARRAAAAHAGGAGRPVLPLRAGPLRPALLPASGLRGGRRSARSSRPWSTSRRAAGAPTSCWRRPAPRPATARIWCAKSYPLPRIAGFRARSRRHGRAGAGAGRGPPGEPVRPGRRAAPPVPWA